MPLAAPIGDHPFSLEILRMVREFDASRPRSMQKHLGPSEVGSPCMRQLGYKLAGMPEINQTADPWFPIIGSAVHEWLGTMAQWYNDVVLGRSANPRFIIENRVKIAAETSGYDTSGSTDLYDTDHQRVVDWKIVGATTMKKVREHGNTEQYRVQGHTYAKGWEQAGYPVRSVMIAYLPRSNFLSKMHLIEEPYDPTISDRALARVGAIEQLLKNGVTPETMPAGECTVWCPFYRPNYPLGATSCPGHGKLKED